MRAFTAGLFRLREFQRSAKSMEEGTDADLIAERELPGVWVSAGGLPPGLSPTVAITSGWWYGLRRMGSGDSSLLRGELSDSVIEVAAASMRTNDAAALVSYALTFWGHLACHNFLQGITEPHDTWDVSRYAADGVADHLGRVISLRSYGFSAGIEPLDPLDPTVANAMSGGAMPMFAERSRRLGRELDEREARGPRRAWRQLGARAIYAGLPAVGASVVPAGGGTHVTIGAVIRAYRSETFEEVVPWAFRSYADHIANGARASESLLLEAALAGISRPW